MASEVFQLALLLTLKDAASGGLDRFEAKLRAAGKAGDKFHSDFQKIREDLNRDLAIGGVGVAGLATLGKGVKVAADFQSSMSELRSTMSRTGEDGKVDMQELADRMLRSEAVALRLGNALPGTTEDFIQMMQVLKQNGLDAETILNGAADAVGNLAVATNSVPREIAGDFARFGNLYKLKADEYTKAADTFSRIYTSTGQTSAELIEAAKYFQGRAGQQLGIGGLKDAEQWTRLYGFMGKQGMQGSMAGMGLTNFFQQYTSHRDKLKDLEKETGIKLNFFDKAGKFVGLEEVITQMSQFNKLTPEKRTAWMDELFGTLGSGAANVLASTDAWKQFNAEQDQVISLSTKTAEASKNFNNQLEALTGTGKNLVVAVFEPVLGDLTSITKGLNEAAGGVQTFVKDHPTVAKYAVTFAAVGSAALVAYSGIKLLTTGVRIYRIASQFARSEGLIAHLTQTNTALATTGNNLATATTRAQGLGARLRGLPTAVQIGLTIAAIGFTWEQIDKLERTIAAAKDLDKERANVAKTSYDLYRSTPYATRQPSAEAKTMATLMQGGRQSLSKSIGSVKNDWTDSAALIGKYLAGRGMQGALFEQPLARTDPQYKKWWDELYPQYAKKPELANARLPFITNALLPGLGLMPDRSAVGRRVQQDIAGANYFQKNAPSLQDPNVMRAFRTEVMPGMNLSAEMKERMESMLKLAFPESFAASLSGISTSAESFAQALASLQQPVTSISEGFLSLSQPTTTVAQSLTELPAPIDQTQRSFVEVYNAANRLPSGFNNALFSSNNFANSLDGLSVKIASWQPPASPVMPAPGSMPGGIVAFPGRASGGVVERPGFAFVHPGNVITPAGVTRGLPGFESLMSLARRRPESSHPVAFAADLKFGNRSQVSASSIFSRPLDADGFSRRVAPSPFDSPEPTAINPSVLTAGSFNSRRSAEQPIEINYSPQITIQGNADRSTVEDMRELLLEERKAIVRMIRKDLANGRVRA